MSVQFVWGALTAACVLAAVFFLRFWRTGRDRFFLMFALAFLALGVNWFALALLDPSRESRHSVYVVRLAAFVLILIAIVDKNRSRRG